MGHTNSAELAARRAAIVAAVAAAGERGLHLRDGLVPLLQPWYGNPLAAAYIWVGRLRGTPHVHAAVSLNHKAGLRFFARPAWARAFATSRPVGAPGSVAQLRHQRRKAPDGCVAPPVVVAVDRPVAPPRGPGEFSRLGVGRYAAPASVWVAAVAQHMEEGAR